MEWTCAPMDRSRNQCDVLVVGAGPAGLAAAFRGAQAGRRVVVVDDNPDAGGQIWRGEKRESRSPEALVWLERIRSVEIDFIASERVFQKNGQGMLLAETTSGKIRLARIILISPMGALERLLPFPGWTLPNVTGASALHTLVKMGLPVEARNVLPAESGQLQLAVAG